jgi:hypothetical protein
MIFPDELLERAARAEPDALAELDRHGLVPGASEALGDYLARVRDLRQRLVEFDQVLDAEGRAEVEGIAVEAAERIPAALFAGAGEVTDRLYGFATDWVPGFYINPSFGLLFGGCAFHFFPEFFALFIIRKSFADRERWLIYTRRELLAHEMCHIGRAGLASRRFEETLAYQTATSAFRRYAGCVFRTPRDALLLLGPTALLLLAQVLRVFALPSLPIWPFWVAVGLVAAGFAVRLLRLQATFARARRHLADAGVARPLAVLYRCTDGEIVELSRPADPAVLRAWLERQAATTLRWRITCHRFGPGG